MIRERAYDILVVDDEEEQFVVVRDLFAKAAGHRFRVRWARHFEEGLAAATGNEPDLWLVDHNLGAQSGLELIGAARRSGATAPMVLLVPDVSSRLPAAPDADFDDAMAKAELSAEMLERAILHMRERRRVVVEPSHSDPTFRSLFDANPVPHWIMDAETRRFVALNQAAINQYGYSKEEFLALHLRDIQAEPTAGGPEDRSLVAAAVEGLVPLQHVRKDGSRLDVDMSIQDVTFDGRPALLVVARNVTESLSAIAALRQSEYHLRELATNINAVFFVVDPQTRTALYLSPAYERLFEQSIEEASSRPDAWLGRIHEDDRDSVLGPARDGPSELVFRIVRRDGSVRWIHARWATLPEAMGKPMRAVGTAEDITELRRAQQQAEASSRMEAVGRLAGGVAHDFNNILTVILGETEILRASLAEDNHEQRASADEVLRSSLRAADLTRQLLAFGRQQMFNLRRLNLNTLVLGMDKLLRRTIGEDVELWTATEPDLGAVLADAGQIEQIVMNLAVNARDAMPDGGRLTIETSNVDVTPDMTGQYEGMRPGPYVTLVVSDVGVGMPDHVKAHIFEPFFTTKAPGKGTGLGLATVYGIVKQSGGYIEVESQPRKGTAFRVFLPRVEGPADTPLPSASGEPVAGGTETILVIEDEQAVRHIAERVLTRQGYRVLLAASGYDAIQVAANHDGPIDAVLSDIVMPKMSGPDAARIIREMRPDVRVLFMSGYTDRGLVHEQRTLPGASFLQKPFTPEALLRTLRLKLDARDA